MKIPLLLSLSIAAGCADATLLTLRLPIAAGQADTDRDAVVVVYSSSESQTCAGSLIAPRLVLTARNCIAEATDASTCRAEFGALDALDVQLVAVSERLSDASPANTFDVAAIYVPDETALCDNDIALVVLEEDVPGQLALPLTPRLDGGPDAGATLTVVGYGTTIDDEPSGTRRAQNGVTVECAGDCDGTVGTGEFRTGEALCRADAGAPALSADGLIAGVGSRSNVGCDNSVFTSSARFGPWLLGATLDALGEDPTKLPPWHPNAATDPDEDGDGVEDESDNCPSTTNAGQADADEDGLGDVCDPSPEGTDGGDTNGGSETIVDSPERDDGGCSTASAGPAGLVSVVLAIVAAACGRRRR